MIARFRKLCPRCHSCRYRTRRRAKKSPTNVTRSLLPCPRAIRLKSRCWLPRFPPLLAVLELVVSEPRRPDLERLYHRYLETENTAAFVQAVSQSYLVSTLERLAAGGGEATRRAR